MTPARAENPPRFPAAAQRIDKWLWCARIFKTRTLAGKLAADGAIRLTRDGATQRISKASALVRPGDRIAFMTGPRMRVLEILACGERRGPASEARLLYADHSPPPAELAGVQPAARAAGAGRPTKRDRRKLDRWNAPGE